MTTQKVGPVRLARLAKPPETGIDLARLWANYDFATQTFHSLAGPSWFFAEKGRFPEGRLAPCCSMVVEPGEVVITIPVYSSLGDLEDTAVVHRSCLAEFMLGVPESIDVVKGQYEAIRSRYVEE